MKKILNNSTKSVVANFILALYRIRVYLIYFYQIIFHVFVIYSQAQIVLS